jgi:predicted lactoylglutathione lyase
VISEYSFSFAREVGIEETHMETNRIELTPEQKGVLASLSQETGEPVDVLIDKVLQELQGRVYRPKKGFKEVLRSWSLEDLDLERVNRQDRDDCELD